MFNPLSLLSGIALSACSVIGIRTEEEPRYTVRDTLPGPPSVEIRAYAPRVAAETDVAGDPYSARGTGFRRVAGYIFGGNHAQEKIAMTAPVAQAEAGTARSAGGSERIAMTAPVAQQETRPGVWTIRFFMPAASTMATLPAPDDPLVRLVEVPGETVAVLRFSGVASPDTVARQQRALQAALQPSKWRATGEPFAWFYDPPWTLPPLRRNEAVIRVEPAG